MLYKFINFILMILFFYLFNFVIFISYYDGLLMIMRVFYPIILIVGNFISFFIGPFLLSLLVTLHEFMGFIRITVILILMALLFCLVCFFSCCLLVLILIFLGLGLLLMLPYLHQVIVNIFVMLMIFYDLIEFFWLQL